MPNPFLIQDVELFKKDYEARIASAKEGLSKVASKFLCGFGAAVLPPQVVAELKQYVERGDMAGLGLLLRHNASSFSTINESDVYWPLVDSLIFFTDSLKTNWPYMTLSKRVRYLSWVEEFLNDQAGVTSPAAA
jgi:hypothetical protein